MRVQISTDWDQVGTELRNQMHAAPGNTRKDLARMIGNVEGLIQKLGTEEIELRRNKKNSSRKREEILEQIEEAINDYEKWLMLAHLQHG
jgi:sugar-specific transcriptional regulator TrmB